MAVREEAPARKRVAQVRIASVEGGAMRERRDRLVAEEPLEIRAAGPSQEPVSVAVTMRTPGHDMELAAGFLFTEGLIASPEEIETMRYCGLEEPEEQRYNIVTVHLRRPFDPGTFQRNFYATSSCGVCGKASIDQVEVLAAPLPLGLEIEGGVLECLPEVLREAQDVFEETGGLHATGLFTPEGELVAVREDVGRHNAMDKLVGHEFLAGRVPAYSRVAVVSGRVSFELVQKSALAGIPILCAVSAPTTLAVDTAKRLRMTLVGFLRGGRYNVYSHPERIMLG